MPSANAQGKDFICSAIAPWFLYNYTPSRVVITAPTDRQVKEVMWSELETRFNNARVELPGKLVTGKLEIEPNWKMIGFTTKETGQHTGKAQGFHSPHVCVIVSEAQAVEDKIYEQLDSLLLGEVNLLILIGNPLRTTGKFARSIRNTTDNIVISLDALDSINYKAKKTVIPGMASYEWIEKKRKEYCKDGREDHPLWLARVRGRLPTSAIDTVFSTEMVEKMVEKPGQTIVLKQLTRKIVVSCDPAGMGDDEQVIYGNISGQIKETDILPLCRAPEAASRCLQMVKKMGSNHLIIECDGLGQPIADIIRDIKPAGVTLQEVHESGKPEDPQFENARAEIFWYARTQAEDGKETIPDDEILKQELQEIHYFINLKGRIQIEPTEDIKERLGRSPNRAVAWVLNVWGRRSARPVRNRSTWESESESGSVRSGIRSAMAA